MWGVLGGGCDVVDDPFGGRVEDDVGGGGAEEEEEESLSDSKWRGRQARMRTSKTRQSLPPL